MAHAVGLIGHYGYTQQDADDILQELILAARQALPRFNPAHAKRSTFLYAIIRHKVIALARHASREKRDRRNEAFSLDDKWPGDLSGNTPWHDVVGTERTLDEHKCSRKSRVDIKSLQMDMAEVLADMPSRLRKLCLLYLEYPPEEARRKAGMAKVTHHRAIQRIRAFFERRGGLA